MAAVNWMVLRALVVLFALLIIPIALLALCLAASLEFVDSRRKSAPRLVWTHQWYRLARSVKKLTRRVAALSPTLGLLPRREF